MSSRSRRLVALVIAAFVVATLHTTLFPLQKSSEDSLEEIERGIQECAEKKSLAGACFQDFARRLLSRFSLRGILDILADLDAAPVPQAGSYVRRHELAHFLGREAYAREKSVGAVYPLCTSAAGSGCYHGVMEEHLLETRGSLSLGGLMDEDIAGICGNKDAYARQALYQHCLHGLGHGFFLLTNADLPRALVLCDRLPQAVNEADLCWTGVFMENGFSNTRTTPHYSRFLKEDDPLYPCDILVERYRGICYGYQVFSFAARSGYVWDRIADLCADVPLVYRGACFFSYGGALVFSEDHPLRLRVGCEMLPPGSPRTLCVRGVVFYLVSRYAADAPPFMERFCAVVDEEYRGSCWREVGVAAAAWAAGAEEMAMICARAHNEIYMARCTEGVYLQTQLRI